MAETGSISLTLRIHPEAKEGLRAAAEKERPGRATMVEGLIRGYCSRSAITAALPLAAKSKA